jgi:four helix bundle protein
MSVLSFRDLTVWQEAMALVEDVYRVTEAMPRDELFGLRSQLRRSAISVPSNIAEGHARDSTAEFLRFISIAMGSIAELETQLLLANRLQLCDSRGLDPVLERVGSVGRLLRGLQRSIRRVAKGA